MGNIVEFVNNQVEFFNRSKVDKSVVWEKESQFAIQALSKNKTLAETATRNLASLQNAIINIAAIGITLNPASKHAYLVPRDGQVCLDISYIGLMHLATQSGSIVWGQCKLVHENDKYENIGLDKAPVHSYTAFKDRGPVIGGYCTVKIKTGEYLTEEMSLEEITKVQNTSKSKKGPWMTWWEQMARKTIVKRASRYWPTVDRLDLAIDAINQHEGLAQEIIETEPEIKSFTPDQKAYFDSLIEKGDAMGMHVFRVTTDQGVYTSLYNSFPKGQKTKYKEIISGLEREGCKQIKNYVEAISGFIAQMDEPGLIELIDELTEYELDVVKSELSAEQLSNYNQMVG